MAKALSLLLVEDDNSLRDELKFFLHDFFDDIDAYVSAEEAYARFLERNYDIVMTDIRLPQEDGLCLVKKIKKKNPEQLVIVVSAHREEDYFLKSIDLGIFSFLTKPFDSQQLINTISRAINRLQSSVLHEETSRVQLHDGVVFDTNRKMLYVGGVEKGLSVKEELFLSLLVKNANHFVPSGELL